MPAFGKKSLSFFIRNDCPRQFRLSLYSQSELAQIEDFHHVEVASPQGGRPGARLVMQEGDIWQDKVVSSVKQIFGVNNVYETPPKPGEIRPQTTPLEDIIDYLQPNQFAVETEFEVTALCEAKLGMANLRDEFDGNGFDGRLTFAKCRPDILQVLEPGACSSEVRPDGTLREVEAADTRMPLRVIDVKLTSEPGSNYFAEVVYYSIVLAAWLESRGKDHLFCVSADGAVWPGSYEASELALLAQKRASDPLITVADLIEAMKIDLEFTEFSVYLPRLRRFLRVRLPELLATPWDVLPWHVNYRCQSCDYLGYPWNDKQGNPTERHFHCWQMAHNEDSIKRIPGVSKNGVIELVAAMQATGISPTVAGLATLTPDSQVFDGHSNLRARRSVLPARAQSLELHRQGEPKSLTSFAIQGSGASAILPSNCALNISISLDYDPSSAITVALSLRANWFEPKPFGVEREGKHKTWGDNDAPICNVVMAPTLENERDEFIAFLKQLRDILAYVRTEDKARIEPNKVARESDSNIPAEPLSTYQIYLWDDAQFRHLTRLMTRHLDAIQEYKGLEGISWLFPAENIIPHPDFATRQSPISLVYDAVEHHVAVPVPHHYSLHEVGQLYHPINQNDPENPDALIEIKPAKLLYLYSEPLTNLIPGERVHEFWTEKVSSEKFKKYGEILQTSRAKSYAISLIVQRLQSDPGVKLLNSSAPALGPLTKALDVNWVPSQLMHQFTKLNGNLQIAAAEMTYALPPVERETRFRAAHLPQRLSGLAEIEEAFDLINPCCGTEFTSSEELWIYRLSSDSREVKIKAGDFGWALSPRDEDLFLNLTPKSHGKSGTPILPHADSYAPGAEMKTIGDAGLTKVTIEAIDRQNGFIVLKADRDNQIPAMEAAGDIDFSHDVMLDEIAADYLSKKVKMSLLAAGKKLYPVGHRYRRVAQDFLFEPFQTATQTTSRDLGHPSLAPLRASLNDSQQIAFDAALSRRLSVIWGPPGTGKSRTLCAIARGAVAYAQNTGAPLRLLVTANNYNAVDNVLFKLEEMFRGQDALVHIFRVQSTSHPISGEMASKTALTNILLDRYHPSPEAQALRELLENVGVGMVDEIVIVGTITHQIHNLAVLDSTAYGQCNKGWFDLVLLDEASQMDSGSSALIFTKVAPGGSCVLAGDDLQLPPIQQTKAPEQFSNLVGSVYHFMAKEHHVEPLELQTNYRSNTAINQYTRLAGYQTLNSHSPNLRLHLTESLPVVAPAHWPDLLVPFDAAWAELLDPQKSLACFIYDDTSSGQANYFEASVLTALAASLWNNMGAPHNENNPAGQLTIPQPAPYDAAKFWGKGVGFVAPHRAQGSLVVTYLNQAFPSATTGATAQMIREAVDTVERFQGQERDVILASFGLGDPEIIAGEDEFLYGLNRFNVLVSRARTKLVLLMTRSLLDHLPNDQDVLRQSAHLKNLAEGFCTNEQPLTLHYFKDGAIQPVPGVLKWR